MDEWEKELKNVRKIKTNRHIDNSPKKIVVNPYNYQDNFDSKIDNDKIYELKKNETSGIDNNTDRKLRLGKIRIDMKIDFHGLTLDEALNSLIKNINYAYVNHYKFLLIITGKGRGTQKGRESIKSSIEKWLSLPELSSKIIKYTDAQQKDGGTGALYILLKS